MFCFREPKKEPPVHILDFSKDGIPGYDDIHWDTIGKGIRFCYIHKEITNITTEDKSILKNSRSGKKIPKSINKGSQINLRLL